MSRITHTSPFILSCLLSGVAGTTFAQESTQAVDQAYTPLPPYELPVAPPSAADKNSAGDGVRVKPFKRYFSRFITNLYQCTMQA